MEEKIGKIILAAKNLPGYKIHPLETYTKLKSYGINDVTHPKNLFNQDIDIITKAARSIVAKHRIRLAATGFISGLPGGPWGIAGGTVADLEEYIRRMFLLAQEVGHVYGLIPIPYVETISDDAEEYFDTVQEEVFKAILIGLGIGGFSMAATQLSKFVAEKEAKEILARKISQKVLTELAKRIARVLGIQLSKRQISRIVLRAIPILGGGFNATICYYSLKALGNNLIKHFREDHLSIKESVMSHWEKKI